jgi:GNAT superfamily N-acetyltransferase
MALPLLRHGLTVTAQVAARAMGRPTPFSVVPGGVTVRPIEAADVDAAVVLEVEVVAWDAQFGGVFVRESTPRRVREDISRRIGSDPVSAWVAVHGGEIVGYAAVDWPADAAWMAGTVATDPQLVAYLGCQSVRADGRGTGIGTALATYVHDELDAAGIEVTLLHHAALNPLSTPFWARCGYRPVRSIWEVGPHTLMR